MTAGEQAVVDEVVARGLGRHPAVEDLAADARDLDPVSIRGRGMADARHVPTGLMHFDESLNVREDSLAWHHHHGPQRWRHQLARPRRSATPAIHAWPSGHGLNGTCPARE